MRLERISLNVPTRAPGGRTAAYVVGDTDALLVDPAATDERIDEALDRIEHVAVTHHHRDHVGRVAEYAAETDITVWCRYGREDAFSRATGHDPDRTFRDGTTIPVEGGITVRETPGHAIEHVGFEFDDGIVIGDLAVATGSVTVNPPEGDMRAYLTSLRRVHAMAPERLFPAHGPIIDDPRGICERLIRHRLERERRVFAAVVDGNRTVNDILDAAYEKDLEGVRDLARATVRAHLDKLHHEQRIRWDGSRADTV